MTRTKTKYKPLPRLHIIRGTRVAYAKNDRSLSLGPTKGELGIICEVGGWDESSLAIQWDKSGWQAWFYPKDLLFVSKRSLKWLDILDKRKPNDDDEGDHWPY